MNVPGCQIFIGIKIKRLKWSYYIHHHLDTSCHPPGQVLGVLTECGCGLVARSRVTRPPPPPLLSAAKTKGEVFCCSHQPTPACAAHGGLVLRAAQSGHKAANLHCLGA